MIQFIAPLSRFAVNCHHSFFGFPSWYEYLKLDGQCQVTNFTVPDSLVLVGLALVDMLLRVAGLAAIFFIIYAGIQYVTSQGNPDAAAKAKDTIINALIGLAVAVVAVGIVSFIGSKLA